MHETSLIVTVTEFLLKNAGLLIEGYQYPLIDMARTIQDVRRQTMWIILLVEKSDNLPE